MQAQIKFAKISLKKVIDLYTDCIFFNNLEWQKDDLREVCVEFIVFFEPIADAFACGELKYGHHEAYHQMNRVFARYFGIWKVCADALRQPNPNNHWFFRESPWKTVVLTSQQYGIQDKHILLFGKILRGEELLVDGEKEIDALFVNLKKNALEL